MKPLYIYLSLFIVFATSVSAEGKKPQPPVFSHKSGFYDTEFELILSHPENNVAIYYTLDGSVPDPNNLKGVTYRYKNSYQQPPQKPGKTLKLEDDYLYNEYKTYKYTQAIPIRDRTSEPDRISQISTTFDETPTYFPEPKKIATDSWKNQAINWTNKGVNRLNQYLNRIRSWLHKIKGTPPKPYKIFIGNLDPIDYKIEYSFKGTPVRAMAVSEEGKKSKISTHTLFVGDKNQFSLPIIALTIPEKELFDYDEGVYVPGKKYDDWLETSKAEVGGGSHGWPANWKSKQKKNGIGINFYKNDRWTNDQADIRVHGNASRRFPVKSLRLYQGTKSKRFAFDIFSKVGDGARLRINLRNGGSVYGQSNLNDVLTHELTKGLDFGTQEYHPILVFINGEFFYLSEARERKDIKYIQESYGIKTKKIDLVQGKAEVKEGSILYWDKVNEFLSNSNPDDVSFYNQLDQLISIGSFIDYYASSIFVNSQDWPANNIAQWRYAGLEKFETCSSCDGRWRWILYDRDHSFSKTKENTLAVVNSEVQTASKNQPWATFMLRTVLKNEAFRDQFITRFTDLINTTFTSTRMKTIIDQLEKGIENEMPRHIERWKAPKSIEHWRNSIVQLENFAEERPAIQRQHLQEFFELPALYTARIDVSEKEAGTIKLNTLHLGLTDNDLVKPAAASARATNMTDMLAFPWQGEYFQKMPLTLEAVSKPDYKFSHWTIKEHNKAHQIIEDRRIVLRPIRDFEIEAVFERI